MRLISMGESIMLNRSSGELPEPRLGDAMEWTAPAFEEICLNCEINSYASATL
jgi:coenzyme PQQ precursor peptide PqqA